MASMTPASVDPGAATFAVDRLDVHDGELLVEGRWSGVRGMRFLRPTLIVGDRQVLATLEHKPWAPDGPGPWTAAFPWPADVDQGLGDAWLEVAPSLAVPLHADAAPLPRVAPAPVTSVIAPVAPVAPVAPTDVEPAAAEPRPGPEPPAASPAGAEADLPAPLGLAAERRAEDAERARRKAEADRDRGQAMIDEAVRDREAAVRTRDRLVRARDEAVDAKAEAERHRDADLAEARRERDEARAQRDEVLAAHRALEATLRHERAEADRARTLRTPSPPAADGPEARHPPDDDAPIGIRAIPAARAVGGLAPTSTDRAPLQAFDRWALRVLATAAATCFVLLLLLLVRVFV